MSLMDNSVFNNLFKSSSNASEVFSQIKKLPVKEYLPITSAPGGW